MDTRLARFFRNYAKLVEKYANSDLKKTKLSQVYNFRSKMWSHRGQEKMKNLIPKKYKSSYIFVDFKNDEIGEKRKSKKRSLISLLNFLVTYTFHFIAVIGILSVLSESFYQHHVKSINFIL